MLKQYLPSELRDSASQFVNLRTPGDADEDGESDGHPAEMREARIRSNIADVYGVICGELASPSSGLNSAISGKENSLIKLAQLFLLPFLSHSFPSRRPPLSFILYFSLPSARARPAPFPSTIIPGTSGVAVGRRRGGSETADSDVTRLDSFSSDLRGR